jgi:hypothetical protein
MSDRCMFLSDSKTGEVGQVDQRVPTGLFSRGPDTYACCSDDHPPEHSGNVRFSCMSGSTLGTVALVAYPTHTRVRLKNVTSVRFARSDKEPAVQ